MGLFDFFESVAFEIENAFDTVKDKVEDIALDIECKAIDVQTSVEFMKEDVKSLTQDVAGLKQDLDDLAVSTLTQGDVECASDIRAEADGKIRSADKKYQKKYEQLQDLLRALDQEWEKLYAEKKEIADRLNCDYSESIKIPEKISWHNFYAPDKKEDTAYDKIFDAFGPSALPSPLKVAVKYSLASQRLEEARQYREEAIAYETKLDIKMAEMTTLLQYTEQIESVFREENELLSALKKFMDSSTVLNYEKIASEIEMLLSEALLSEDGHMNQKYRQAVTELKGLIGD